MHLDAQIIIFGMLGCHLNEGGTITKSDFQDTGGSTIKQKIEIDTSLLQGNAVLREQFVQCPLLPFGQPVQIVE